MTKTLELCDPQDDIGYLLWCIMKTWQRGKHKLLDEYGVTASQLEVMGAIYSCSEDQKEITQVILSQETNIDPMTISTILRNLQKKGLVDRTESPTDTRARLVEFTAKGRDLFIRALTKVREEQDILFNGIDQEALKEQLRILLNILNKNK